MTGLGIDTLRAWERRYRAVEPSRDDRGRLYTDADVARLRLMGAAVAAGHRIGQLSGLSDDQLRRLTMPGHDGREPGLQLPQSRLDSPAFREALLGLDTAPSMPSSRGSQRPCRPLEFVRDVLMPTLREVGDGWDSRRGGVAHEHLVSSTLRSLLGSFMRIYSHRDAETRLLFATPSGDRHEIGILGAAMLAARRGLAVSYLGPDLPADEVIAAVSASGAHVVVIGVTLANAKLSRELRSLVRDLPPAVELWAGGAGAQQVDVLRRRGLVLPDFDTYLFQLERLVARTR